MGGGLLRPANNVLLSLLFCRSIIIIYMQFPNILVVCSNSNCKAVFAMVNLVAAVVVVI